MECLTWPQGAPIDRPSGGQNRDAGGRFALAPLDGLTRIAAPDPLALATSLAAAAASIARLLSSTEN